MSLQSLHESAKEIRILYVEDDQMIAPFIKELLKRYCPDITLAANGKEGLALFEKNEYDIVISDIRMPVMNGIEMCKRIKQLNPDQRIVITSANDDSDALISLIDLGVDKFVLKPLSKENLFPCLSRVIQSILDHNMIEEYRATLESINTYNHQEQTRARKKQLQTLINDLEQDSDYRTRIIYEASDILSGDSYSIYRKPDGAIFIYLLDAMGHGVSPSMTSFAIASAINRMIPQNLLFSEMMERLLRVLGTTLIDYEQLSGTFIEISPDQSTLTHVTGGMYPGYLKDSSTLHKLASNNPPFMNFNTALQSDTVTIEGFQAILLYTDGLSEYQDRPIPQERIRQFIDPDCLESYFEETLQSDALLDDLTVVHIQKA